MINIKGTNSLLRKELGINISKLVKEGLKDIKIPERAISYDAIKVGREASPAKHYTNVYIFRDKDGNIVSSIHNKIDNEKIKQTIKKYSVPEDDHFYINTESDVEMEKIKRQKIRGYEKENGKITKCFEENRAVSTSKKKMESLRREVFANSDEIIKISHFENKKKPMFVENYYQKAAWGSEYNNFPEFVKENLLKKVLKEPSRYAGSFELIDSKISNEQLRDIAQHKYFLPYFSPDNKFIYRMSRQVEKEKKSLNSASKIYLYSMPNKDRGFCRNGFNYTIGINRLNQHGINRTRSSLVNTLGHEFGHADWNQKVIEYEIAEFSGCPPEISGISKDQIEKIKRYRKAINEYEKPEENRTKYMENFAEIMARQEGRKTLFEYENLDELVSKFFPSLEYLYKGDLNAETEEMSHSFIEILYDMRYRNLFE